MNSKGLFINNNTFISKRKNKGLIKAKIYNMKQKYIL